jgi:hemolysin activation/secretion protein
VLATGNINLDRFADDKTDDASKLKVAGAYQKLEMNGGLSQALGNTGIYTGSVRWKAQAASKNLDTYNKISLGGVNGIRAYSSIDGVGDQGAQMSFDIIHQVVPDVYGGLFYDVGMVKTNLTPLSTSTGSNTYVLRGAGWQVGGKIAAFNWSLSMGYAMGQNPASFTSANTQRGDVRGNFVVTRTF